MIRAAIRLCAKVEPGSAVVQGLMAIATTNTSGRFAVLIKQVAASVKPIQAARRTVGRSDCSNLASARKVIPKITGDSESPWIE